MQSLSIIAVLLIAAWLTQLYLSMQQYRRYYKRFNELKRMGDKTAVGTTGNMYSTRAYAILVVDEKQHIIKAEKLTGATVFANLKPVPELEGRHLSVLEELDPQFGLPARIWEAFQQARLFIIDENYTMADWYEERRQKRSLFRFFGRGKEKTTES